MSVSNLPVYQQLIVHGTIAIMSGTLTKPLDNIRSIKQAKNTALEIHNSFEHKEMPSYLTNDSWTPMLMYNIIKDKGISGLFYGNVRSILEYFTTQTLAFLFQNQIQSITILKPSLRDSFLISFLKNIINGSLPEILTLSTLYPFHLTNQRNIIHFHYNLQPKTSEDELREYLPCTARLVMNWNDAGNHENLTIKEIDPFLIQKNDILQISRGSICPCDGIVAKGTPMINEKVFTGETTDRYNYKVGDRVFGGCQNYTTFYKESGEIDYSKTLTEATTFYLKATDIGKNMDLWKLIEYDDPTVGPPDRMDLRETDKEQMMQRKRLAYKKKQNECEEQRKSIANYYSGFPIWIARIVMYQGVYVGLWKIFNSYVKQENKTYSFIFGYFVTATAGLITYPLDMIKQRQILINEPAHIAHGNIVEKYGMSSLWNGALVNVANGAFGVMMLDCFKKIRGYNVVVGNKDV